MFAIKLLANQLPVVKIRKSIGLPIPLAGFFNADHLAILVKNLPLSGARGVARLLAPHRLPVLIVHPHRRFAGMSSILTFTLNFPFAVEIKPGVDLAIIFAGDFLTHRFSRFVVDDHIGLAVEINILLDSLDLTVGIIIDPAVHFAIPIGILLLARYITAFVIIKTCDRLLWIGGR